MKKVFENQKYNQFFLLILFASLFLRLVGVTRPLLGNFSSVQCIYAMMARNYRDFSWNLFVPRLDVLMQGEPGIRLLDLPLISYGVALLSKVTFLPIDWSGRLWSGIFSILSLFVFVKVFRHWFSEKVTLLAVFFFAFSPLSIVYGQSFQTDATSVFFLLVSILFLQKSKDQKIFFFLSSAMMCVVLMLRIQFIFMYPVFLFLIWDFKRSFLKNAMAVFVFGLISSAPLFLWNLYIYQFIQQDIEHVIMSIYHQLGTKTYSSYKPWSAFFVLHAAGHFFRLVLNPLGAAFCLWGLFSAVKVKGEWQVKVWFGFMLLMLCFLSKKAIDMNYYWLGIMIPSSVLAAKAFFMLLQRSWFERNQKLFLTAFCSVFILASLRFAGGAAYLTPAVDQHVIEASRALKKYVEPSDLVVAANGSNLNLLFYTGQKGWEFPVANQEHAKSAYGEYVPKGKQLSASRRAHLDSQESLITALEYYRNQGADYFVSASVYEFDFDEKTKAFRRYLGERYQVLEERADAFLIVRL